MEFRVVSNDFGTKSVCECENFYEKAFFIVQTYPADKRFLVSDTMSIHRSLSLACMKLKKSTHQKLCDENIPSSVCHFFLAHFVHVIMNDIHSEISLFPLHMNRIQIQCVHQTDSHHHSI